MGEEDTRSEWLKCQRSVVYFIHTYCKIYDATSSTWIPFTLWREQATTIKDISTSRKIVILKARQLGMTWACLCYGLWLMLFHPSATVLIFSRREDEAKYLMDRLRDVYTRLPDWAKVKQILASNTIMWQLSNGSIAYDFPTTAGDSYTATLVIVDEADLVPDLGRLMNAVKPTIDGGGQMILLSRVDKSQPKSMFKLIYQGAKEEKNGWNYVFLPWYVRPERTQAWYEEQKADIEYRTGSLDDLYQQYPATDEEALRPLELDKRIPYKWLKQCYEPQKPLENILGVPDLRVYAYPIYGRKYFISGDPAEGNPTSDPSAAVVIDNHGQEVASLSLRAEPAVFASYLDQIGVWYYNAQVMVERNNHGHSVIMWLKEHSNLVLMPGRDGNPGWMSSSAGKAIMYSTTADSLRDFRLAIHNPDVFDQLGSVEGATLKAPPGLHDDLAMGFGLVAQALFGGEAEISTAYGYVKHGTTISRRARVIANQLR